MQKKNIQKNSVKLNYFSFHEFFWNFSFNFWPSEVTYDIGFLASVIKKSEKSAILGSHTDYVKKKPKIQYHKLFQRATN